MGNYPQAIMKETAVISGSTGFIGSHLANTLRKKGIRVVPLSHELFDDPIKLRCFFEREKPDYIYHLAAYGNMAYQTEATQIFEANLLGTFMMLNQSKHIPYKAFINVSSSSVILPYQTMYSATKRGAEELCKAFVNEYGKQIVSIRPFSVYGPGEAAHRFIPTVFRSCLEGEALVLADGSHDWIYIDEVVNVLLNARNFPPSFSGEALDAGTGTCTSNADVVRLIEKITGKKANIVAHKQLRQFDTNNWKAEAQYTSIPLEEGLMKVYEAIKKQRS